MQATLPHAAQHRVALVLMLASGFAGLGYQIVWTQQCALWLGHESAAVLAVVTAFFGGLSLGAWACGRAIERSARPERVYAACEALIALWAVALAGLLAPVSRLLLDLTGVQPTPAWQWGVAFIGTFVVLLPATAAMGATLPAMERVSAQFAHGGNRLAALYAGNTLGAVVGVLAAAFWLVPAVGLMRTAGLCALLNLMCAGAALLLASNEAPVRSSLTPATSIGVLPLLAATGLLGIGYEVLVVRVLSQVSEDTVYTFAMLLAIYLVGSALGAAAYQRWLSAMPDTQALRRRLLCAQAAACLQGTLSLWGAEALQHLLRPALGEGLVAALVAEAAPALAAFGLPTFVMGALFSHLAMQARAQGHGFGRALGVNTLGAAAAPLLFGVLLVPALGPKFCLLIVATGYWLMAWPRVGLSPAYWAPAGAAAAVAVWAPPLAFIDVSEGGRVLSYQEGAMAAVSVVEDEAGVSRLRIDNRQQEGSSATRFSDARQALLPLLLHPSPQRALFLGLGTGITAASAAQDGTLQVDAVELLPEVIAASAHFTRALATDHAPRLHLMAADARRYVRTSPQRYDVIVSDNFHPARSGSAALYTVEHFQAVQGRLSEHGVFCQWLPLHQLDLATLRSIVRAFITVYPQGAAWLATNSLETPVLGLVARADAGRFELASLRSHLAQRMQPQHLADFGLPDEFALLGGFVAGPQSLAQFAGHAPLNTDDHPIVAYLAPRITYAPDSLPRDRLAALLGELHIAPEEVMAAGTDATWLPRLAAYWSARNRFLEAGQHVQPLADPRRMLAQVREPLLAVLRISPEFRPAYDPLLRMAMALADTDARAARELLTAMKEAQPSRPEAGEVLGLLPR